LNLGSTSMLHRMPHVKNVEWYSFTGPLGASFDQMARRSQSSFVVEFCLFASASSDWHLRKAFARSRKAIRGYTVHGSLEQMPQ